MSKSRIIVADRQRSARSAVGMMLAAQPDLEMVGEAADLVDLLAEIRAKHPDVVVVDWDVVGPRIEVLMELMELFDEPPAIVGLSVREEHEEVARGAGLAGFTCKGEPPDRLLKVHALSFSTGSVVVVITLQPSNICGLALMRYGRS